MGLIKEERVGISSKQPHWGGERERERGGKGERKEKVGEGRTEEHREVGLSFEYLEEGGGFMLVFSAILGLTLGFNSRTISEPRGPLSRWAR